MSKEESLEALGLTEREVLHAPDDQCGPVRELGQVGFDILEVWGRSDELPGGNHRRGAPSRISLRREAHRQNLRCMSLGEAAREEILRHKVERRREGASYGPTHHPTEDTNTARSAT